MSLILKIMSGENLPDDDSRKSYILRTGVKSVEFVRVDGLTLAAIEYADGTEGHSIPTAGNAYLMTEQGKTISSFSASPVDLEPSSISINGRGLVFEHVDCPIDAKHLYNMLAIQPGHKLVSVHRGEAAEIPYDGSTTFVMHGMSFFSIAPDNQLVPGAPLAPA